MKITFLGTGAADWNMQDHGHMEGFRRNSAALLDDCLLIDPNADVPNALETFGKDAGKIKYIFNTHRHSDHFCQATVDSLSGAVFYPLSAGEEISVGGYTVKALRANHATCADPTHLLISDGKTRLFYGLDGAWLMYDEIAAIKEHGVDLAVLDATIGDPGDFRIFEHNDLAMVLTMKAAMKGYVKRFCISHMARTLHRPQAELASAMAEHDVTVAYDGLELEI